MERKPLLRDATDSARDLAIMRPNSGWTNPHPLFGAYVGAIADAMDKITAELRDVSDLTRITIELTPLEGLGSQRTWGGRASGTSGISDCREFILSMASGADEMFAAAAELRPAGIDVGKIGGEEWRPGCLRRACAGQVDTGPRCLLAFAGALDVLHDALSGFLLQRMLGVVSAPRDTHITSDAVKTLAAELAKIAKEPSAKALFDMTAKLINLATDDGRDMSAWEAVPGVTWEMLDALRRAA